jgi:predicted phage tail protein
MAVSGLVVFLATTSGYFHTLGAFMMLGGVSATAGGTFRRLRQRRTPPNDR